MSGGSNISNCDTLDVINIDFLDNDAFTYIHIYIYDITKMKHRRYN